MMVAAVHLNSIDFLSGKFAISQAWKSIETQWIALNESQMRSITNLIFNVANRPRQFWLTKFMQEI